MLLVCARVSLTALKKTMVNESNQIEALYLTTESSPGMGKANGWGSNKDLRSEACHVIYVIFYISYCKT